MAVNSDPTDPGYGQIRALALPRNTTFPGPSQMQNKIESDQNVSDELLALRRGGSAEVELGNLLTLPVAGGLMYVEPVYARATEGASYPTLRKVIVSFGDQVAITDSYADSLAVFFAGVRPRRWQRRWQRRWRRGGGTGGDATAQQQLENALADAAAAYERGQEALATGDFAAYGEAQQELARRTGACAGRGRGARARGATSHAGGHVTGGNAEPLTVGVDHSREPESAGRPRFGRARFDPVVCRSTGAGWSSSVARWAHNPEVAGSNPAPATNVPGHPHRMSRDFSVPRSSGGDDDPLLRHPAGLTMSRNRGSQVVRNASPQCPWQDSLSRALWRHAGRRDHRRRRGRRRRAGSGPGPAAR